MLYVIDPGGPGSLGEVAGRIAAARDAGRIGTLIVQAIVESELTKAADVVLPGCAWVEKDASYTNGAGTLQVTSESILPPGEARNDWQILVDVAAALGVPIGYTSGQEVRQAIAALAPGGGAFAGITEVAFARPAGAKNWLEASNPMERVKWDVMFQDVPPFKFDNTHDPGPRAEIIPLREVE